VVTEGVLTVTVGVGRVGVETTGEGGGFRGK